MANASTEMNEEGSVIERVKRVSNRGAVATEETEHLPAQQTCDAPAAFGSNTQVPVLDEGQPIDLPAEEEAAAHDLEAGGSAGFNVLACVAFALSILGLVLLSTNYGAWLVLAAIVMGIIALIQISQRGERGKGFAFIAIALPVTLFFLALLALSQWSYH